MESYIFTIITLLLFIGIGIYFTNKGRKATELENKLLNEKIERYQNEATRLNEEYSKNGIPIIESDIALKSHEKLYAKISNITWNELRRHTTNVSYGGISTRIPIMKGLSYRAGSYNVNRETTDVITPLDKGDLYVTSKAIFFRGRLGNKTIQYNKIVNLSFALDGFNIERETGKSILINGALLKPNQIVSLKMIWENNRG